MRVRLEHFDNLLDFQSFPTLKSYHILKKYQLVVSVVSCKRSNTPKTWILNDVSQPCKFQQLDNFEHWTIFLSGRNDIDRNDCACVYVGV